jgi:hypothetical protein
MCHVVAHGHALVFTDAGTRPYCTVHTPAHHEQCNTRYMLYAHVYTYTIRYTYDSACLPSMNYTVDQGDKHSAGRANRTYSFHA